MMLLTSVLVPFAMASRLERLSAVLGALEEYLGTRNARLSVLAPTCENSVDGVDEQGNICKWTEAQMGGPGLPYCDAWADLGWCGSPEQLNMNTCCRKSCGLPPCGDENIAVLAAPGPAKAPLLLEPPIEPTPIDPTPPESSEDDTDPVVDCFVYGATYGDRTVAGSSVEASPSDCQARCASVDGCSYFTFKTGSGRCYLSGPDATLNALSAGKAHKALAGPAVCELPVCCTALTAECEACQEQITVDEFCEDNPNFDGCSVVLPGTQTTTTVPIITPPPADCENSVDGVDAQGNKCMWNEVILGGPDLPNCDKWSIWCGSDQHLDMDRCCAKTCGTCTGMPPLGRAARMLNALARLGTNVGPPPSPDFTIEDEYNW